MRTLSFPRVAGKATSRVSTPQLGGWMLLFFYFSVSSISLKTWEVKNPLADSAINPGFSCSLLNLTLGRQKKKAA